VGVKMEINLMISFNWCRVYTCEFDQMEKL